MLHTIIALEDMFYSPAHNTVEYQEIPYGMAAVENTAGGKRIQSIFSTDPMVYLNPQYGIGQSFRR